MYISHLFNIDDVIVIEEWSLRNIKNIVMALDCFYLAYGLKLSVYKSNLYGVGVVQREVGYFADITGCKPEKIPFMYLGIPVGAKMGNIQSWNEIIDKFNKKLSKWKAKLLSIGGRLTLISSVLGSMGIYYFSMILMPAGVRNWLI
ncbi:uncharacterized protein LOC143583849 [Bidens hawaiensis]|uniref:uncharacterized protein LOC143583849 n=1 Tax=Bidens hawaiensis TaxID=980011 RepID=UPI00404ABFC3